MNEVFNPGDEILVVYSDGITPFKVLRVVERKFQILTKYYYELKHSNGDIKWISSTELDKFTTIKLTSENTSEIKPPETPKKPVITKDQLNFDNFRPNEKTFHKEITSDTTKDINLKSLTSNTHCKEVWYYNEYNLWFIKTKLGNYISIRFSGHSKILLVKTTATLEVLDVVLSKNRVDHSYYYTTIADIFGDNNFIVAD